MTILQLRRRAAGYTRRRPKRIVFRSYAHRGGARCACNECRWARHLENACDACGGDGVNPEAPMLASSELDPYPACKGSGQREAAESPAGEGGAGVRSC